MLAIYCICAGHIRCIVLCSLAAWYVCLSVSPDTRYGAVLRSMPARPALLRGRSVSCLSRRSRWASVLCSTLVHQQERAALQEPDLSNDLLAYLCHAWYDLQFRPRSRAVRSHVVVSMSPGMRSSCVADLPADIQHRYSLADSLGHRKACLDKQELSRCLHVIKPIYATRGTPSS